MMGKGFVSWISSACVRNSFIPSSVTCLYTLFASRTLQEKRLRFIVPVSQFPFSSRFLMWLILVTPSEAWHSSKGTRTSSPSQGQLHTVAGMHTRVATLVGCNNKVFQICWVDEDASQFYLKNLSCQNTYRHDYFQYRWSSNPSIINCRI